MSDSEHDDEPGGGWKDELDEAGRRALAKGPCSRSAITEALRMAMAVDDINDNDVNEMAARVGATWSGDMLSAAGAAPVAPAIKIDSPREMMAALFQQHEDRGVMLGRLELCVSAVRSRDAQITAALIAEAERLEGAAKTASSEGWGEFSAAAQALRGFAAALSAATALPTPAPKTEDA